MSQEESRQTKKEGNFLKRAFDEVVSVLVPALEVQVILGLSFVLTLLVSWFYIGMNDPRFPVEQPMNIVWAALVSFGAFAIGQIIRKVYPVQTKLDLKHGAFVILLVWFFACSISSFYFILSGFPVPAQAETFGLWRQYVDGFYEAMSGFTTTGTSILPSVEAFPRSVIFYRSWTHWVGGMGIAYMIITLWRGFQTRRGEIINSEAETPVFMLYKDEEEAINSGAEFLKVYVVLSVICTVLLLITGAYFRVTPYTQWYDNVFDALTMMFGALGTGGFGVYDTSVGLMQTLPDGTRVIGGLQNPMSEWVLAFFMAFAGMNLALWYMLMFKKKASAMFNNTEFRAFWAFIILSTLGIWAVLMTWPDRIGTALDNLRYAFFSVTTIVSTTGYANTDFSVWPIGAIAILFLSYLMGGSVGSTGGGLKTLRFVVLYKYCKMQILNVIHGRNDDSFVVDGMRYDNKTAGLILVNMIIYFLIFFAGAVLIALTSATIYFVNGGSATMDLETAFTAAIANLGNIGPAVINGASNSGATGNYSAFSVTAKVIMAIMMFIGRVGVLTIVMLFISRVGQRNFQHNRSTVEFDSDAPMILK